MARFLFKMTDGSKVDIALDQRTSDWVRQLNFDEPIRITEGPDKLVKAVINPRHLVGIFFIEDK